jgi:hypothetical protein
MARRGKKNAQAKIINEIQNQLMIQADLLGIKDLYTPEKLEEMSLESAGKILAEFYMEKSNLEYELNMLGTNKRELMMKLKKLDIYINRAHGKMQKCKQNIGKILEKMVGDQKETNKALKLYNETPKISIKIGRE